MNLSASFFCAAVEAVKMVRFFYSQSLFGYFLGTKSDKTPAKALILPPTIFSPMKRDAYSDPSLRSGGQLRFFLFSEMEDWPF
jgi:hypothetical protein